MKKASDGKLPESQEKKTAAKSAKTAVDAAAAKGAKTAVKAAAAKGAKTAVKAAAAKTAKTAAKKAAEKTAETAAKAKDAAEKTAVKKAEVPEAAVGSGYEFIRDLDQYLYDKGVHYEIFRKLGAHPSKKDGVSGIHFAVWAPHAAAVHLIGEFNGWNEDNIPMERLDRDLGVLPGRRADRADVQVPDLHGRRPQAL